jgi:hypothetical protein
MLASCGSEGPAETAKNFAPETALAIQRTDRLDWIKSTADFDQKVLTESEVDARIARLVQNAVDANQLTADIEIPINTHKLEYLKQVNPFTLEDLKGAGKDGLSHYDKSLHIYKYGDVYISTPTDTQTDQMNVYYTARSLEILKTRYPEAYNRLFVDSKRFLATEPKYGDWLNRNKLFWVGFNTNPSGVASNNHFFITGQKTPNRKSTSVNIAAINIHNVKILGKNTTSGPRPIYNQGTDADNYRLHMREGLIVSIVHEMMHNYIQYAAGVSDYYNNAVALRNKPDGEVAEESVVMNTTYRYFNEKGGLMPQQETYYYREVFDVNMTTLQNKNLRVDYAKHYSNVAPTDANLRDVFWMPAFFSPEA